MLPGISGASRTITTRTAKELRWGTNGARSVDVAKGTWFDHEANEGGGVVDLLKREGVADPWQWLRENGFAEHRDNGAGAKPKIVATYNYTDEHENLLFQVVRLDPKTFRQRRPARPDDPPDKVKNGWVWSVKGVRQVPFRLPELIEALALEQRVFIVEGEKDVLDARPPRHHGDLQSRRCRQMARRLCRAPGRRRCRHPAGQRCARPRPCPRCGPLARRQGRAHPHR